MAMTLGGVLILTSESWMSANTSVVTSSKLSATSTHMVARPTCGRSATRYSARAVGWLVGWLVSQLIRGQDHWLLGQNEPGAVRQHEARLW